MASICSGHVLIKVLLSQSSGTGAIKTDAGLLLFCLIDKEILL